MCVSCNLFLVSREMKSLKNQTSIHQILVCFDLIRNAKIEHDWIAQMVKGLSSVVPGSGFDLTLAHPIFVRTDTNL